MLFGLHKDGHDSIILTSLSQLYGFVNILYVRTLNLLLFTSCHAWSRLDTLRHEFLYIVVFYLYTVSVTLADAT
jgi:hypothetical protein